MNTRYQKLFILWDERDGYNVQHLYLDCDSAKVGLAENYSEYWINSGSAKIESIKAVSYFPKSPTGFPKGSFIIERYRDVNKDDSTNENR